MNILFINSARRWGGNERWTQLAADGLADRGHNVYLAYRSGTVASRFQPSVRQLHLPFLFELDLLTIFRLFTWAARNKIEVMIPTKPKEYFIAGLLRKPLSASNVLRLGIVREVHRSLWQRLLYQRWADGIIVNAAAIRETLIQRSGVPAGKVRVIYNGHVASHNSSPQNGRHQVYDVICKRLLDFEFVIAYHGELSARKGCDRLLEYFARLAQQAPQSKFGLCLIGDGDLREALERRAERLNVSDKVIMHGHVAEPHLILRACHAFALLSMNEGIPNALLEAMACGLPAITTPAGGVAEAIRNGDNGFLINADEEEEFVAILHRLHENPQQRAQIGRAAQATIAEKFSPEKMLVEMESFLAQVWEKRRNPKNAK